MPARVGEVCCGECGQEIPGARPDDPIERRQACPACGSVRRLAKLYVHDEIKVHSDLKLTKRRPGDKKSRPAQEQLSGDVLSADGVWRTRVRVLDRENDWYEETVLNADGSVHQQAHPLNEHTGHGSAKRARPD
jgi:DNA-directed RNA polymerase subunit RPC12/RpoP